MGITHRVEKPKLILLPKEPLQQKDLADLHVALANDPETKDRNDLAIEWQPAAKLGPDPEWQRWARHYDTLAWQVASIFSAASAILVGGYVNARINCPDAWLLGTLALAGIGLVLFQMFIVGAFRTYRYELYDIEKSRAPDSPALAVFRKKTGGPWAIYCVVAGCAAAPWVYALAKCIGHDDDWHPWAMFIGGVALLVLFLIGRWARPPVYPSR
jgi:hypothetical protein